jgi:predicted aldo/keto reductase-like oxidoreductase
MSYLGEDFPKLGFGLMRLPMLGKEVDLEQMIQMTDLFMGERLPLFRHRLCLRGRHVRKSRQGRAGGPVSRDSFLLASKLAAWEAGNEAEAKQMFWTSLERTNAGYLTSICCTI